MPQFTEDGDIVFCLRDNGYSHVYRVAQDGSGAAPLVNGTANVSGLSVAGSSAAIVLATPESFGDVALLDLSDGTARTLTDYGTPEFELVPAEERRFTISDGTVVTGWLRRDPDAAGPLPLLLDIHGGPHNAWNGAADIAHPYHQVLTRRGWAVLTLNPEEATATATRSSRRYPAAGESTTRTTSWSRSTLSWRKASRIRRASPSRATATAAS